MSRWPAGRSTFIFQETDRNVRQATQLRVVTPTKQQLPKIRTFLSGLVYCSMRLSIIDELNQLYICVQVVRVHFCRNGKWIIFSVIEVSDNNMSKEYIIQIGQDQSYPFGCPKTHYHRTFVTTSVICHSQTQLKQVAKKIELLSQINSSSCLIHIERVVETSNSKFIFYYEYVPQPLKDTHRLTNNSLLYAFKQKLQLVCQLLARERIKHHFQIEDIGINEECIPKLFLGLKFTVMEKSEVEQLNAYYEAHINKFMEVNFNFRDTTKEALEIVNFSDYSLRLNRKLIEIEGKLQKRNNKKRSSSRSNSDKSKSKSPPQGNILYRQSSDSSFSSSYTSNSCISGLQISKPKIHKSSFGDYQTTSYCLNQSKDDTLTQRITTALERTQTAFKVYEKLYKHSHKKLR